MEDYYEKTPDGTVINNDRSAAERYKAARANLVRQHELQSQVSNLEEEFSSIKNDVSTIKDLLLDLNSRIS